LVGFTYFAFTQVINKEISLSKKGYHHSVLSDSTIMLRMYTHPHHKKKINFVLQQYIYLRDAMVKIIRNKLTLRTQV